MNVTLVILAIVAICGIYLGGRKGFAKSFAGFIALVATLLMLGIILRIYDSYTNGQTMDMIVAIIILAVLGAIYGILRVIAKTVKAIANLPVIAVVDKLLGAVLGVLVVVCLYHILVIAVRMGYFGSIGQYIQNDIENNDILTHIARYDVVELCILWKNYVVNEFIK